MATKEDVKIARLNYKLAMNNKIIDTGIEILKNPVVEMALGVLIIAYFEKSKNDKTNLGKIRGMVESSVMSAGLSAIITAQQLSALMNSPVAQTAISAYLPGTALKALPAGK